MVGRPDVFGEFAFSWHMRFSRKKRGGTLKRVVGGLVVAAEGLGATTIVTLEIIACNHGSLQVPRRVVEKEAERCHALLAACEVSAWGRKSVAGVVVARRFLVALEERNGSRCI